PPARPLSYQIRGVGSLTNHQKSVGPAGPGRDSSRFRLDPAVAFVMSVQPYRLLFLVGIAVGLGSGCNQALNGIDAGGKPCSGDTDCGAGQHCVGFSKVCPTMSSAYTIGVGTCHRDCSDGACSCLDATECRSGQECDSGQCISLHFNCPLEPTS